MTARGSWVALVTTGVVAAALVGQVGVGPGPPPATRDVSTLAPLDGRRPLRVDLRPEDDELVVLSHLPLSEGPRYVLGAALREAGRPVVAARQALPGGPSAALAVTDDLGRRLSAPHVTRILLPHGGPRRARQLELSLLEPRAAEALVRLFRRAHRAGLMRWLRLLAEGARDDDRAARASTIGWARLTGEEQRRLGELELEQVVPARAAGGAPRARRVVVRALAPPPRPPASERIDHARAAAVNVLGPGAVAVSLEPAGAPAPLIELTVTRSDGTIERSPPLRLDQRRRVVVPIAATAATVAVASVGSGGARARFEPLGGARPLAVRAPPGEDPLAPDRRLLRFWRLRDGQPGITVELAGDGGLRIVARPVGTGARDDVAARLCFALEAGGARLGEGEAWLLSRRAPLDRLVASSAAAPPGPGAFTTEPLDLRLVGRPGGALRLAARDGSIDVALLAHARDVEEERRAPPYELPLPGARLRNAPFLLRRWVPLRPLDPATLLADGRAIDVEAQVRLDPAPGGSPPPRSGSGRALAPRAPRRRHELVERLEGLAARRAVATWRRGLRTLLGTDEEVALAVPRTGAGRGRVRISYHLEPGSLGRVLELLVDERPAARLRIATPQGAVQLSGLAPGSARVRIRGAAGWFAADAPPAAGGARVAAIRSVYDLRPGRALEVAAAAPATLNVVLYAERPVAPGTPLELAVEVDGGRRRQRLLPVALLTRLERRLRRRLDAMAESVLLDRGAIVVARAWAPIHLGADLGGGLHSVRVTLRRGPALHARFFVFQPAGRAEVRHWTESDPEEP